MSHEVTTLEWIVIGAGPAGIAGMGKLLDAGFSRSQLLWIDPQFKVGDFGSCWRYIGSNTPVESFTKFFRACSSFAYSNSNSDSKPFLIDKIDPEKNCPLALVAEPLQKITNHLLEITNTRTDTVTRLIPIQNGWQVELTSGEKIHTRKVLLAMGAAPKTLHFDNIPMIPLSDALNPFKLRKALFPEDTVAVFGSAQSSKSVLGHLSKINLKKKILFYRSNTSFDRHIDEKDLEGFLSLKITPKNLLLHIPECTKIIYAIGFERRHIPIIGLPNNYDYDQDTGEIAPGIYGLGMAFPNILKHEMGLAEYRVAALWPVMKRLSKLLPGWLASKEMPPAGHKALDINNHAVAEELIV